MVFVDSYRIPAAAIILAAGKGTRMNSQKHNKVMLPVGGKPMIERSVEIIEQAGFSPIILVVGFGKEEIQDLLKNRVLYAVQDDQLGTAHAAQQSMRLVPDTVQNVLIVNGDDSYNYPADLLLKLTDRHRQTNAAVTLLTITVDDPSGLGRIIRDNYGKITMIQEEKDASDEERKIAEVNPQCWVFTKDFLQKYLPDVTKSPVTGEYYLVDLIRLASEHHERVESVHAGNLPWRGVNRPEELEEARRIVNSKEQ